MTGLNDSDANFIADLLGKLPDAPPSPQTVEPNKRGIFNHPTCSDNSHPGRHAMANLGEIVAGIFNNVCQANGYEQYMPPNALMEKALGTAVAVVMATMDVDNDWFANVMVAIENNDPGVWEAIRRNAEEVTNKWPLNPK